MRGIEGDVDDLAHLVGHSFPAQHSESRCSTSESATVGEQRVEQHVRQPLFGTTACQQSAVRIPTSSVIHMRQCLHPLDQLRLAQPRLLPQLPSVPAQRGPRSIGAQNVLDAAPGLLQI